MAGDVLCGGVDVRQRFESVKMRAKGVSARWLKASRALQEGGTRFMGRCWRI